MSQVVPLSLTDAGRRHDRDDAARQARKADRELSARRVHAEHHPRAGIVFSLSGSRTTFIVGALLTAPRRLPLAGLDEIHKLKYSTTSNVLLVIGFNPVMLWLLEVLLPAFAVAPAWTPGAINRANAWVSRHAHVFAEHGSAAVGALLVIKGS